MNPGSRFTFAYLLALLALLLVAALPASAQTGGQFCIRSFEDRDGDGVRSPAEPLLTRGVAVNLLNADGVTVASGLLENSPTAAQGIICFQFLPAGQYGAIVTSADFEATTSSSFTSVVSETGQPVLVEFGARRPQPMATAMPEAAPAADVDLLRVGLSLGGALLTMLGMVMIGLLIYVLTLNRRNASALPPRTTPVMEPAVASGDTGKHMPTNPNGR